MEGKILVVDDDAHLRETIRDNLELEGYEVVEAGNGAQAVKAVRENSFDVVLMDFNLPDTTGLQVIRHIRTINTQMQILMLTAHASLDTAVKAIQESVYDFLVKPVDFDYLRRVIAKCVDKLRLEQENRRLIEDLQRANEQLLYLSNMKSKFLSMSSHDLSNSLMTLQVSFEMLMSGLRPSEDQKKTVNYISGAIAQLARLIEDLVDWASIEQGKFRLELSQVSAARILEDSLAGPQAKAAQRDIRLRAEASGDLPQIMADKRRLSQVLGNLLENALRYTPKGGSITVSARAQDDCAVQFSVRDTGEGIASEEIKKIFESFYQSTDVSTQRGRLGLGLSISREIVQGHGGKIWVESGGKGKGATFYFTVPVKKDVKAVSKT